jgi:hypothetical protein
MERAEIQQHETRAAKHLADARRLLTESEAFLLLELPAEAWDQANDAKAEIHRALTLLGILRKETDAA